MKRTAHQSSDGFSLIELLVGIFIMATVITAGLTGLSQSQQISSKSKSQALANLILRSEVEQIRTKDWPAIESFYEEIKLYEKLNEDHYTILSSNVGSDIETINLSTAIKAEQLSTGTETGKIIFHVTVSWDDIGGKAHEESRVFVVTEGGVSA